MAGNENERDGMLPELEFVCELASDLESQGVRCWIDSGTLLGIYRDGKLIPGDNDIDIGVLIEAHHSLSSVAEQIRRFLASTGRRTRIVNYAGSPYKIKSGTESEQPLASPLDVDINIFRESGPHAWCPQTYGVRRPDQPRDLPWLIRRTAYQLLRFRKSPDPGRFPWSRILVTGTWWYPIEYVRNVRRFQSVYPVPDRIDEYLAMRYGDWRTPDPGWSFKNDGALRTARPEELVGHPDADT